jgi:hypothetical protein
MNREIRERKGKEKQKDERREYGHRLHKQAA